MLFYHLLPMLTIHEQKNEAINITEIGNDIWKNKHLSKILSLT